MKTLSIYNYNNPKDFLADAIADRQRATPTLSIRKISQEMGFKSHALLLMLMTGKRPLRVKHARLLAEGLKLSSPERLYLQALIQFDSAHDTEERELCRLWLSELHPHKDFQVRELDEFSYISHWIHTAILSCIRLSGNSGSVEEVHQRLGHRVSRREIESAIERLLKLNLVKHQDGKLIAQYQRLTTKDDVVNQGAQIYHKAVSDLAKESIEKQSVKEREFQSFSIAIKKTDISLAKEMIRKFRAQFTNALITDEGDEVYQMNLQFFQLTESPAEASRAKVEDEGVETESTTHNPSREISADKISAEHLVSLQEKII
jgi:uncharacterized protein (TIGR02147 family)